MSIFISLHIILRELESYILWELILYEQSRKHISELVPVKPPLGKKCTFKQQLK